MFPIHRFQESLQWWYATISSEEKNTCKLSKPALRHHKNQMLSCTHPLTGIFTLDCQGKLTACFSWPMFWAAYCYNSKVHNSYENALHCHSLNTGLEYFLLTEFIIPVIVILQGVSHYTPGVWKSRNHQASNCSNCLSRKTSIVFAN